MSTHAVIAMIDRYGNGRAIYCHQDGSPFEASVGGILFNHYKDESKVVELIDLGNIVSLGEEIATCRAFHRDKGEVWEKNQPIAYHQEHHVYDFMDKEAFVECKYAYVFVSDEWYAMEINKGRIMPSLPLKVTIAFHQKQLDLARANGYQID